MNVPRLEIHLNQELELCIAKVERPGDESRLIIDMPLDELKALDPESAAHRIGGTVLNILGRWHKQAFRDWQVPSDGEHSQGNDSYNAALGLITQALAAKTTAHNASIEWLLQQASADNADARKYLEDAWPLLRERLGNT
ncbi:hypothetical protein [Chitinimonas taiwanensis]|uniref:hypothetical protein n=1 Tax=Chitinimonas taiwanensis TaxID=240412 RepID=UPI000931421E|nr:hypothetical protein [Chitinimonas taiwanensis]